jgi:TolB-like protein/tetratricopeptide (TPR) repeat protein
MASLLPGFDNDIFISYRQKDNRGEQWVSSFVEDLRNELDKTFKEEISLYFDINSHNGILATHDVEASLRNRLKCLVFIPVLSRTYCDPGSFAWENEFRAFVEKASADGLGLSIVLPTGNVVNRVIPVQIYDLERNDIRLFESVLGSKLKGIEFIYREPGVNRPMTRSDRGDGTLSGSSYRNQINRVANAIKEVLYGIMNEPADYFSFSEDPFANTRRYHTGIKQTPGTRAARQEKSIIVLPFENISSDPGQDYFSDGLTEEVISDLSLISDLLVISRRSAMAFRNRSNTIREIAEKVNVRYVLEGSVRKESNNLRITAQLIDSENDSHIWSDRYSGTLEDVFDIQEKVSKSIVGALRIKISEGEMEKISERPIDNAFAYDCYHRAYPEIMSFNEEKIGNGLKLLQKGIDIAGENAVIYAGMASAYFQLFNAGIEQEHNLLRAEEYVGKAFSLNPELAEAHFVMACIKTIKGDPIKGMEHILKAHSGKPDDPEILIWLAEAYTLIGRSEACRKVIDKCMMSDPLNPMIDSVAGWSLFYDGKYETALNHLLAAYEAAPQSRMNQFWKALVLFYNKKNEESHEFITRHIDDSARDSWSRLAVFLKLIIEGDREKTMELLTPEFVRMHWADPQNSYLIGAQLSYLGQKTDSLKWIQHSVESGFMNYPFLKEFDPLLENIRGEEKFVMLLEEVRNRWVRFESYCNIIT